MPARDPAALSEDFEALYRAHFAFVWRSLKRLGVPPDQLDDATQDVFVTAHRRFGTWEGRASARAWLYGVARRVAFRYRRSQARRERKHAALPRPEPPEFDARLSDREDLARVVSALDALSPERRQVYVLAVVEGLRANEIADALDCKVPTVYSRLRRARADLERVLSLAHEPSQPAEEHQGHGANDRSRRARAR